MFGFVMYCKYKVSWYLDELNFPVVCMQLNLYNFP
jgi:hypothetical protein